MVAWKLRAKTGGQTKYVTVTQKNVEANTWTQVDTTGKIKQIESYNFRELLTICIFQVSLHELVAQADELTLYLETESEGVDYDVDNVTMERLVISDTWRQQAEEDIERLRKRNITINFSGIDATDLVLNVTQVRGEDSKYIDAFLKLLYFR